MKHKSVFKKLGQLLNRGIKRHKKKKKKKKVKAKNGKQKVEVILIEKLYALLKECQKTWYNIDSFSFHKAYKGKMF